MGYTTDFSGEIKIEPALTPEQVKYLKAFSETRRMKRDVAILKKMVQKNPDKIRTDVNLPLGEEGGYYVSGTGHYGQDATPDVIDSNHAPSEQPGLWCQWEPSKDGTTIAWNEGEKFYSYLQWMQYLVEHFLKPWKRVANGTIYWQGEDEDDFGQLIVEDNVVKFREGERSYGELRLLSEWR